MAEEYCKCGHAQSNHHNGKCSGQVRSELPKMVLCECKGFDPKKKSREDLNQAAARIVREATED